MNYCPNCGSIIDREDATLCGPGAGAAAPDAHWSTGPESATDFSGLATVVVVILAVVAGVVVARHASEGLLRPWAGTRWRVAPRPFPYGFAPPCSK